MLLDPPSKARSAGTSTHFRGSLSMRSALSPLLGGAFALLLATMAVPGGALAVTFPITSDHCTGGCGTPPFGTVTVTQNGANVDISVSLADSNRFVLTGSADMQYFKFNGAPSLASITVDQTAAGTHLIAATGSF